MSSAYGSLALLSEPNQTGKQKTHPDPSLQNGVAMMFSVLRSPHEQVSFAGMDVLSEFQKPENIWAGDGIKEGTQGSDAEYFDQMEAHLRFLNMDLEMEVLDLESCYNVGETYNNTEAGFASASYEAPRLSLRGELAMARQKKKRSPSFKSSGYRHSKKGYKRNQTDRQPRRSARLTAELQKTNEIATTPVTEIDTALEQTGVKGGNDTSAAGGKVLDSSAQLSSQSQDPDKLPEPEPEKQEVSNPSPSPACNELEPDATRKSRKERKSAVSEKEQVVESSVGLARCNRRQSRKNAKGLAEDSSEEEFADQGHNQPETCDLDTNEPAKLTEAQEEEIGQLRKMPETSSKKKSRAQKNKTDFKLEAGLQTRRKPETRSDRKRAAASATARRSGNVAQEHDRQEPGRATGEDGGSVAGTAEEVSEGHLSDECRDAAEGQKTAETDASSMQGKDFGLVEVDNTSFEVLKEHTEIYTKAAGGSDTSIEIETRVENMESCALCAQDFLFYEATVGGEAGSEEHRPEATELQEKVQSEKAETDQRQLTIKATKRETQASRRPQELANPVAEDRGEGGQRESANAENSEIQVVQIETKKAAELQKLRMATTVNRRVTRAFQKRIESNVTFDGSIEKPGPNEGKDDNSESEEVQEMDYPRSTRSAAALEAVFADSNAEAQATAETKPGSRTRQKRGAARDAEAEESVEAKPRCRTRQKCGVVTHNHARAEASLEAGVAVVADSHAEAEASVKSRPGSRTRRKHDEPVVADSHAEAEKHDEALVADKHAEPESSVDDKSGSRTRQKRGEAVGHASVEDKPGSRTRQKRGETVVYAEAEAGSRTRRTRGEAVVADNRAERGENKSGSRTRQKRGDAVVHAAAEASVEAKPRSRTKQKRGEPVVADNHSEPEARVEDKSGSQTRQKHGEPVVADSLAEAKASLEARNRRKRIRGVPVEELDAMAAVEEMDAMAAAKPDPRASETTTTSNNNNNNKAELFGTGPKTGTTKNNRTSMRKSPRLMKQTPSNSSTQEGG